MDEGNTGSIIVAVVFGIVVGVAIGAGVNAGTTGISLDAARAVAWIALPILVFCIALLAVVAILIQVWKLISDLSRKHEQRYPAVLALILTPIIAPLPESFSKNPVVRLDVAILAVIVTELAAWLVTKGRHRKIGTAIYYALACCVPLGLWITHGSHETRQRLDQQTSTDWFGIVVIVLAAVLLPLCVRQLDRRRRQLNVDDATALRLR